MATAMEVSTTGMEAGPRSMRFLVVHGATITEAGAISGGNNYHVSMLEDISYAQVLQLLSLKVKADVQQLQYEASLRGSYWVHVTAEDDFKEMVTEYFSLSPNSRMRLLTNATTGSSLGTIGRDRTSKFVRDLFSALQPERLPSVPDLAAYLQKGMQGLKLPVIDGLYEMFVQQDDRLEDCIEPASVSSAWRLATLVSHALDRNMDDPGDVITLAGHIDVLIWYLWAIVEPALGNHGLHRMRNRTESSLTVQSMRPDQIVTVNGALLFKGEDKAAGGQLSSAVHDLQTKMAEWSTMYHGQISYLMCYASAGQELVFCALPRGSRQAIRLTRVFDISQMHGKLGIMVAALRVYAVMRLQAGMLPDTFPLVGVEEMRPLGTRINFMGLYVEKKVEVAQQADWFTTERLQGLINIYTIAAQSPYLVHIAPGMKPPHITEGVYTVRVAPVGQRLGPGFAAYMPQDEASLKTAVRCILQGLQLLHRFGWGHGDVRWPNVIMDGAHYVLIDLECCVKLNAKPPEAPRPAIWEKDVLAENGTYTSASDLCLVGKLMLAARVQLGMAGTGLMYNLLCKYSTLTDALAHVWFTG